MLKACLSTLATSHRFRRQSPFSVTVWTGLKSSNCVFSPVTPLDVVLAYKCQHGVAPMYVLRDELRVRRPADTESKRRLINVSGRSTTSTYSSVHCRRQSASSQPLVCVTVFHRTSIAVAPSLHLLFSS